MIGLLVVTHGGLAEELVCAARRIVPSPEPMASVALDWDEDPQQIQERIAEALEVFDAEAVIIATDMLGGTPANLAMTFLEQGRVEVVTGVNLPMVIKFSNRTRELTLDELARTLAEKGRSHITVAGEILAGQQEG